jgi:hypothetical protein
MKSVRFLKYLGNNNPQVLADFISPQPHTSLLQAALAVKRLGPCACFSQTVWSPPEPAPCPVFAALSYL